MPFEQGKDSQCACRPHFSTFSHQMDFLLTLCLPRFTCSVSVDLVLDFVPMLKLSLPPLISGLEERGLSSPSLRQSTVNTSSPKMSFGDWAAMFLYLERLYPLLTVA
ncbi:uncharacterized protein ARMOST_20564 [Armillaria ostoyae]|uniref:Uncharacterized protein n=1 Tax=Armillaria ostoyae TaxID=47428 RepID=A0A284S7P5_ARMOS|nr:uncharacterized protein ARMOST_20564 [Armillaria ostoyae]